MWERCWSQIVPLDRGGIPTPLVVAVNLVLVWSKRDSDYSRQREYCVTNSDQTWQSRKCHAPQNNFLDLHRARNRQEIEQEIIRHFLAALKYGLMLLSLNSSWSDHLSSIKQQQINQIGEEEFQIDLTKMNAQDFTSGHQWQTTRTEIQIDSDLCWQSGNLSSFLGSVFITNFWN